nr:MAG TPA: hypothetical protein [Caudoviricetes sp.]
MNELINVTLNENHEFNSFEELFLWTAREKQKCNYNSQQIKRLRTFIKDKYLNKFQGTIYLNVTKFCFFAKRRIKKRLFAKRTITERSWLNGYPIQTTS